MVQNDPLIGTTVDQRFKVLAFVGKGQNGSAVYRAEDLTRSYTVGLKFLQDRVDDKMKERFRHGVETASVLTHPNIVRMYSFHTTADSRPYFVTDSVQGRNLGELLGQSGAMSEQQAIGVFSQICDALDYAHAKGVVHRNLKPSKIMLLAAPADTFIVKIADFGVSKGIGERETRQSLARKGQMLGNPFYMSPEQCMGQKMDGRSDVYAAGCLLFESLTGQAPFKAANSFDVMNKHINDPIPTLSGAPANLKFSRQLNFILSRAMAKKPDERYQESGEMSRDLSLLNEVSADDWRAQAICMKPVQLKPQKFSGNSSKFQALDLVKPLAIVVGTLVVFIAGLVGLALADPDVPAIAKYKVAVQEMVLSPTDPRLLKNFNYMMDYYKSQRMYAEAWQFKAKLLKANPPIEQAQ